MRQVAILGIGQTKIDEHWDLSLREIGGNAAFAAMQNAGMDKVDSLFVGNMLSPLVSGQNQLGTFFSDWIGLWNQESVKIEAACASGAAALRAGLMAVAAGDIESALVVGVEKMTDKAGHDVTAALATGFAGLALLAIAAWLVRRPDGDRRAFSLVVVASVVATPVVWLHYLALLYVPIAVRWPRLSAAWFFGFVVLFALVDVSGDGSRADRDGVDLEALEQGRDG